MKKIIVAAVACALTISLSACSGTAKSSSSSDNGPWKLIKGATQTWQKRLNVKDGDYPKDKFVEVDGKTYSVDKDGTLNVGVHYLSASGQKLDPKDPAGHWYYLDDNGAVVPNLNIDCGYTDDKGIFTEFKYEVDKDNPLGYYVDTKTGKKNIVKDESFIKAMKWAKEISEAEIKNLASGKRDSDNLYRYAASLDVTSPYMLKTPSMCIWKAFNAVKGNLDNEVLINDFRKAGGQGGFLPKEWMEQPLDAIQPPVPQYYIGVETANQYALDKSKKPAVSLFYQSTIVLAGALGDEQSKQVDEANLKRLQDAEKKWKDEQEGKQ